MIYTKSQTLYYQIPSQHVSLWLLLFPHPSQLKKKTHPQVIRSNIIRASRKKHIWPNNNGDKPELSAVVINYS